VYDDGARLDVTPRPDVVVRVFILLKVTEGEIFRWEEARDTSLTGVNWKGVVGVEDTVGRPGNPS